MVNFNLFIPFTDVIFLIIGGIQYAYCVIASVLEKSHLVIPTPDKVWHTAVEFLQIRLILIGG